jgi:hypothetical protein
MSCFFRTRSLSTGGIALDQNATFDFERGNLGELAGEGSAGPHRLQPLGAENQTVRTELRAVSSRTIITPSRFTNHYVWETFKGDSRAWMESALKAD